MPNPRSFTRRIAISLLASALTLASGVAAAYTSSGADGAFQPAASTVLDAGRQVFNFTDIVIASGVAISFAGLSSAQPIELLATGDINIAGSLDAGGNRLWIQTPGAINISGSLTGLGATLNLSAGSIQVVGDAIDFPGAGRVTGSGDVSIVGRGSISLDQRGTPILLVPEPDSGAMILADLALLGGMLRRRGIAPELAIASE